MLPALFDEAVAPVRILRDHDERAVLEPALTLEVPAEQVVVLVLRWDTHALFGLDLRVETARADAQVHRGTGLGEQLPGVLRDEDPALADIFGAEAVTVGATRNAHSVGLFSHIPDRPCEFPRSGLGSAQAGARIVQKAHQVHDWNAGSGCSEARRDLQHAARVRRHDDVGPGREDGRDLLPLELPRDLRVRQVVDAATAAPAPRTADPPDHNAPPRTTA